MQSTYLTLFYGVCLLCVLYFVDCYGKAKLGHKKNGLHTRLALEDKLEFPGPCEEHYYDSYVDHFSFVQESSDLLTYKQRYFICGRDYWKPTADGRTGPIFFYTGNESPVTLYINATGLMWEWAPEIGALMVFAEHRYYGKSIPLPLDDPKNLRYLSTEQATMDYANLIFSLKSQLGAQDSPVIAFGGSYGGMLSSWMRMKYPATLTGTVAGSAPIWAYFGEEPPVNQGGFAEIETYDATPAAGSSAACVDNVRKAWKTMEEMATSPENLTAISKAMSLCPDSFLQKYEDFYDLRDWVSDAIGYMAMGNYPFPSSYMTNGDGELPAYPMRVMCENLKDPNLEGVQLLSALKDSVALFFNATGEYECFELYQAANNVSSVIDELWGFQYCTEQFMPMSTDGIKDMFWLSPFDIEGEFDYCQSEYGVIPRMYHAQVQWGGKKIETASNIIFSNGQYDPWRYGGITRNISDSVVAIVIPEVGHHCDLMFSTPYDPPGLTNARLQEKAIVKQWIEEAYANLPPSPQVQIEL
eukprot:TRINITY_DN342_c0_g2_i1.p1 TRINITY_DN342_c0_g2~~TRINITY_DN342_c0_g2_i1.p1  ORF type:complete len:527 (+),score=40.06 TRINITY_DN342_c0_g2_i1:195-1775(+)